MSQGIPFFRGLGSFFNNEKRPKQFYEKVAPSLKLQTDKEVYRPGDLVSVTIDISNPNIVDEGFRLLVDNLSFEVKGIEKLDVQWFAKQPPLPGSRQKRGEHILLDCKTPFVISQLVVSPGCTKTYLVRAELPNAIPPSYRGSTVRYLYYVRSTLQGHWLENAHSDRGPSKDLIQLEVRIPLQIWITQKTSGLLTEGQDDENFPFTTLQMDVYWKEEGDSEWARASEEDAIEEGYDSSRDEISSVSSYNLSKGNLDRAFGSSLSLVSHVPRPSNKDTLLNSGERLSFSSYTAVPQLSATEVLYDSIGDTVSPDKRLNLSLSGLSTSQRINGPSNYITNDDAGTTSTTGVMDSATSEGFIRGRSYNIRLDDEILLRFSPKNSDSTYYFSDMIGGTLTFFHEEGRRRCLEVSITLETSETISRPYLHHSRKNSPTITKTQSDHHEVVADILQTSFLFSIPMDGPMSFSTPRISVQWALRFEFVTTPKNVDWTRYEHPLLVEGREKGEWILPITVHAPPPRAQSVHARNEKPLALGDLWIRS